MEQKQLLPLLTFEPYLKSVIWGGERIAPFKGIVTDQKAIGESWEISAVPGHESVVADGELKGKNLAEILKEYGPALVGSGAYAKFGNVFPLLIKIIDAAGDLSVQVHPDDELAMSRHNSLGKTEMWYLIDTDPGAIINAGFSRQITPEEYAERVADNTLMDVIAHYDAKPGDTFFLPAGRVHSIGAGNMLIEVQETSDVTYRIYDFGRVDANGQPRQLHVEEAKDAIDYNVLPDYRTQPKEIGAGETLLVECDHFRVERLAVDGERIIDLTALDSFMTVTSIEGDFEAIDNNGKRVGIARGNSLLVPATATSVTFRGQGILVTAVYDPAHRKA